MTSGKGELTKREYWDAEWRRSMNGAQFGALKWVTGNYIYRSLDHRLKSVLRPDPTKTFLELGSGPGRWLIYFHKTFGYQVFGCDYSPVSCRLARANLAKAGVPGSIVEGDFFEHRAQYDVVFSGGVIEHFDDPTKALGSFTRLVAPGGVLITDVPNLIGVNWLYRKVLKPETFETHRTIRLADLRRWHRELGFEELLGTTYGSVCLGRVPTDAFAHRPRVQRYLYNPARVVATSAINRACLTLHELGVRIDHPFISPHLLVVARKPAGGRA